MKTEQRLPIFRLIKIQLILAKHGIDKVIFSTHWFSPFRIISHLNPWNWFRPKEHNRGETIRAALQELGPIFVKFGQVLSTRRDMLPPDVIEALAHLQDKVPAFPTHEARAIVEKNLGKSIDELFLSFEDTPIAAASIAQVHGAILHNGKSVVVKVLRPHIRKKIQQDIDVLYTLAGIAEYSPIIKRLKPKEMIREFEIHLMDEIDLKREAGNASQLRRNFSDSKHLYIPHIEWEYTTEKVLVMERIRGIPIANHEALVAAKIDLKKLAARGIDIFFTQVFRDAFFHADMHPGNIFVSEENPDDPYYICVDFGIIGTLTDQDKRYIAENLHAFFNRDYRRVAELHMESGWINSDIRIERFESAIRALSEPIFEKPLKDISFAQLFFNLIQTARQFHINVQPQLLLLQKTLLSIEGLVRYLDADLDLWITAKPFLETWIKKQMGVKAFIHNTRKQLPFLAEHLPELPQLLYDFLKAHQEKPKNHMPPPPKKRRSLSLALLNVGIVAVMGSLSFYIYALL